MKNGCGEFRLDGCYLLSVGQFESFVSGLSMYNLPFGMYLFIYMATGDAGFLAEPL